MPTSLKHLPFVIRMLDLLHLDHLLLLQHLHSIKALVVIAVDEMHAPEGAGTESSLHGEVGEGVFALGLPCWVRVRLGGLRCAAVIARAAAVRRVMLRRWLVDQVLDGWSISILIHVLLLPGGRSAAGRRDGVSSASDGVRLVAESAVLAQHTVDGTSIDGRFWGGIGRGPLRVLGFLLLEKAEGRHCSGGGAAARSSDTFHWYAGWTGQTRSLSAWLQLLARPRTAQRCYLRAGGRPDGRCAMQGTQDGAEKRACGANRNSRNIADTSSLPVPPLWYSFQKG